MLIPPCCSPLHIGRYQKTVPIKMRRDEESAHGRKKPLRYRWFHIGGLGFGRTRLLEKAEGWFRLPLLLAYDSGMRRGEILNLQWVMIKLKDRNIRLPKEITKTDQPRTVPLTERTVQALRKAQRSLGGFVFVNPRTDKRRYDFKKAFAKACSKSEIEGLWFHDLRRSFVTNARRRGVGESVVMKVTGHKTRAVFDRYNVIDDSDIQAAARCIEIGREQELAEASAERRVK
jgi:integrase